MPSYSNSHQDYSADNDFDYGRRQPERSPQRTRRSSVRRSSTSTSSTPSKSSAFNGLHRRRNKHWNW
jgi:hypothetical protein